MYLYSGADWPSGAPGVFPVGRCCAWAGKLPVTPGPAEQADTGAEVLAVVVERESDEQSDSTFVTGMKDWKHVHTRIEEHEKSSAHGGCVDAFLLWSSKSGIAGLLKDTQMSARREQVKKRRQVLERVIEIVKVIGKQGLSYRGTSSSEAAYTLEDIAADHGTFLELILLLSKYDMCLNQHLNDCIEKSKKMHESGGKGRGSLVTFFSKTTVNMIIDTIRRIIQESIASEVQEAGMYSVQIDTTTDITSKDQCSIILRYVNDCVHERLIALVDCQSSTGQYFAEMLMQTFETLNIDKDKCIGNATDGAANMQGTYNGFATLLSQSGNSNQIHVWCYSHILNLVLSDTTGVVIESASLFSLLNDTAVFIRESYKRMNMWESTSKDNTRNKRLAPIGETRWWAKDAALRKVFGSFDKPESALYVDLILTLAKIEEQSNNKPAVRVKAKAYMDALLKHETILTAQLFMRIFQHTTPLSKYLQTDGMDMLTAHRLVIGTQEDLKTCERDFDAVKQAANHFVEWANEKLDDNDDCEVQAQAALPQKRKRKKKTLPGESADDETFSDADTAFKVNVHNVIFDTITGSIHCRFLANGTLYSDFACLDPRHFPEIRSNGLDSSSLGELSKRLITIDSRATIENLQGELTSLASHWDRLKTSLGDTHTARIATETETESGEKELDLIHKSCASCKNCTFCCYQALLKYNLFTDAYHVIGLAYKFILTLSVTQVACERSFSTLKFIKNRLRSTLSQEHLEAFMLMSTEKDILVTLDADAVIDKLAERSDLLRRLLTV
ncbi:hypothetical protein SKAU_G00059730 [Synaphobranchus kaupii]|uniref:Zinc finger MYM-type protein 1 n=1 Tax=Synaphobranchus kaupii TaxID=118154 RepID=A0A9Q1JA86_SYNKA|nr:hypothetical protein SKAU_G00059730 [Synaphobranchus kaupii]